MIIERAYFDIFRIGLFQLFSAVKLFNTISAYKLIKQLEVWYTMFIEQIIQAFLHDCRNMFANQMRFQAGYQRISDKFKII